MERIMSSNRTLVTKSQFGRLLNWFGVFMITVVISTLVAPYCVLADSTGTANLKPDLCGYTGPDAPYIVSGLPEPTKKPNFEFTVGMLEPYSALAVLRTITESCEAKVKQLGGKFISYDSGLDIQKQVSDMDLLLSQKVDIIIAYPTAEGNLTQGIKKAKEMGIPVVQINVPSDSTKAGDPNVVTTVGMAFDYYDYVTVKYIAKNYPGANTALISFGPPTENLPLIENRTIYYAKEMGLNFLGKVAAVDPSPNAAAVATQGIIGKYPNVKIILGYNDYATMAAANALRASGKKDILVATPNGGQNITANGIKEGTAICAYRNPWEAVGTTAAIAAYDVLTKQNLPLPKRMLMTGELATKGTVEIFSFIQ